MRSIVLLSGGMDSSLTAAIARRESEEVAALHLNYRHRTEARELRAFHDVADALGIRDNTLLLFVGDNGTGRGTPSRMGDRVVIGGARHEILQERDEIRQRFWAAYDAYLGITAAAA